MRKRNLFSNVYVTIKKNLRLVTFNIINVFYFLFLCTAALFVYMKNTEKIRNIMINVQFETEKEMKFRNI